MDYVAVLVCGRLLTILLLTLYFCFFLFLGGVFRPLMPALAYQQGTAAAGEGIMLLAGAVASHSSTVGEGEETEDEGEEGEGATTAVTTAVAAGGGEGATVAPAPTIPV